MDLEAEGRRGSRSASDDTTHILVSPDTAVSIAAHAVLISLQLKTRPHALDISPSSEHTLVIVTSHTWTVRHESELRQAKPRTLVAFLPEATRCSHVVDAEQKGPSRRKEDKLDT
jgi:hypothetical protein